MLFLAIVAESKLSTPSLVRLAREYSCDEAELALDDSSFLFCSIKGLSFVVQARGDAVYGSKATSSQECNSTLKSVIKGGKSFVVHQCVREGTPLFQEHFWLDRKRKQLTFAEMRLFDRGRQGPVDSTPKCLLMEYKDEMYRRHHHRT